MERIIIIEYFVKWQDFLPLVFNGLRKKVLGLATEDNEEVGSHTFYSTTGDSYVNDLPMFADNLRNCHQ